MTEKELAEALYRLHNTMDEMAGQIAAILERYPDINHLWDLMRYASARNLGLMSLIDQFVDGLDY